jgi:hypothetical protein
VGERSSKGVFHSGSSIKHKMSMLDSEIRDELRMTASQNVNVIVLE